MPVFKTTITVTVFGEFNNADDAKASLIRWGITRVASEMDDGELVGSENVGNPELVPVDALANELEAIDSSADFFGSLDDVEDC